MKILFVQKMAGISGSEKYYLNILPILKRRGIDVHFCCIQHKNNAALNESFLHILQSASITYHVINYTSTLTLSIILKLNRLIKIENFDLVQTNLIHADFWGGLVKKVFKPRAKFICMFHGYDEETQRNGGFSPEKLKKDTYYRIVKFSGKYSDCCIAISKGLKEFLVKGNLIKNEKITVIQYGFDFKDISLAENTEYRFSNNQLIIVGRLVAYKQQGMIIELLPEIKKQVPDVKLVLLGTGAMEAELKEQVEKLGLQESVLFKGYVTNTHDYISSSDVMLIPSMSEGFGVVLLEGWHNQKPIIAFDVPAPNEIIIHNKKRHSCASL